MNKDTQELYDDWHRLRDTDYETGEIWHQKVMELVCPESDFLDKRVLEIGCGRGELAVWICSREQGPREYVAADFSREALKKAEHAAISRGIKNINFRQADICNLEFEDESFDTVISCETIEHVPRPSIAVKELARVLKPSGRLILTTPNYFNLFGIWRGYRRLVGRPYKEAGQPINRFVMLPVTLRWVSQAGLNVELFGSTDLVVPRFRRPPRHIALSAELEPFSRFFGLYSWVAARKVRFDSR